MIQSAMLAQMVEPGPFIDPYKIGGFVVILIVWGRLLTWADKDAINARLPRELLNTANLLGLIAAYLSILIVPAYLVTLAIVLCVFLAEIGVYLGWRKHSIGLQDLVQEIKGSFKNFGKKKVAADKVMAATGEVLIFDKSGNPMHAPPEDSPERRGYDAVQNLLHRPLSLSAERLDLTAGDMSAIVYFVDGVKYDAPSMDRGTAGAAIGYLKGAADLDVNERRKPQGGIFKASFAKKRQEIQIRTAGSSAGESMNLLINPKARFALTLEGLGLLPEDFEQVQTIIREGTGVIVLCAPKGQGLTSLEYAALRGHDVFLQNVQTVERNPDLDLDGITQNKLQRGAPAGEEAAKVEWVLSQQPDVVLLDQLAEARTAVSLAKYAVTSQKRTYIGLTSASALDALKTYRKVIGDDKLAMKSLRMIICGRVLRKLCEACKIGYSPDPLQLRKMNMDPEKITKLFQARTTPMKDAKGKPVPCTFCHDLGYLGRIGVYEILVVDDEMRQAVLSGGGDTQIKAAFRKQKGRYLQEQAFAKVEEGITSVQEVLRVLRGEAPAAGGDGGAPPAARARTTAS